MTELYIGIVVDDDEHDWAVLDNARFEARRLALLRSQITHTVIIETTRLGMALIRVHPANLRGLYHEVWESIYPNPETLKLSSQRDILRLIPAQRIEEVFRLEIRPEVIDDVEICVYGLHRQQATQPSAASPPDHKVNS